LRDEDPVRIKSINIPGIVYADILHEAPFLGASGLADHKVLNPRDESTIAIPSGYRQILLDSFALKSSSVDPQ
jgi:hypothetical protein